MSTFVTMGNSRQPFVRLATAVEKIASILPTPVVVQCGHTNFSSKVCRVTDFFDGDAFIQQIEQADLVIMQAGGGALLQALSAGKTPVLMPRQARYGEIVDDHQLDWANVLETVGKAVVAMEIEDLGASVLEALRRQKVEDENPTTPKLVGLVQELLVEYSRKAKTMEPPQA